MLMVPVYDVPVVMAAVIMVRIDFPYDVFDVLLIQRTVRITLGARHLLGETRLSKWVGAAVCQNHVAGVDMDAAVPTWIVSDSELSDESKDRRRSAPLPIPPEQIAITRNMRRRSVRHRACPDRVTDGCIR